MYIETRCEILQLLPNYKNKFTEYKILDPPLVQAGVDLRLVHALVGPAPLPPLLLPPSHECQQL